MMELADAYLAKMLNQWTDKTLRRALAFIAGILADREGCEATATTLRRVADGLLEPVKLDG